MLAAYDDRPAAKLDTLKKLRILIKHAMKKKWISGDPSTGIKRTKISEVRSWTDDEIRQYENRWQIGTKQRTAFSLMLFTGQRRSDAHRMTWQDISHKTGRIKVIQQKTGAKIQVPLHRDLLAVLEKARHNHVTIVNTEQASRSRLMAFRPSCAMPSEPQGFHSIASRTDCAGQPVVVWRKPDAAPSRSWRCLVTSRLRKRSVTRAMPIRSGWRRTRCRGLKRKA